MGLCSGGKKEQVGGVVSSVLGGVWERCVFTGEEPAEQLETLRSKCWSSAKHVCLRAPTACS